MQLRPSRSELTSVITLTFHRGRAALLRAAIASLCASVTVGAAPLTSGNLAAFHAGNAIRALAISEALLAVTDTVAPVLSLPANITVTRVSNAGTVVSYSATATDAVEGAVAITCAPASGSTFPAGVTTVSCEAHDSSNNTNTGSFTVTVQDVVIAVTNRIYAAYRTDLTAGTFVYADADPAAGSPVRATQRALGYREVDYKSQVPGTLAFTPVTPATNGNVVTYDYSTQFAKTNTVGFWVDKDVPMLIGPDGNAYITDGHHTTAGLLEPNSPVRQLVAGKNRVILGHIVANYFDALAGPQPVSDAWWMARATENNALLYGANGDQLTLPGELDYASLQPILPSTLAMPTTPSRLTTSSVVAMLPSIYRGLTWALADAIIPSGTTAAGAKIAGYKKSAPGSSVDINFVEFFWSDFLRRRVVWDDTLTGSPFISANGDASVIAAPLSFFAATANGIALARSEVYRDEYGRLLRDYTNSTLFGATTVNWANGSLSNGLAAATDTYNMYLRNDSTIAGDITPSARSTNILRIDTATTLTVTNSLFNFRSVIINGGHTLRTTWKDATVSNSTLRFPAGTGLVLFNGTLNGGTVSVAGGTLGGTGTLNGALVVQSAGTLAPGASIGTLVVNGSLTLGGVTAMEINKSGATLTGDLVTGITTLTAGGVLNVTANGDALTSGDSFTLFSAATFAGAFAQVNLPALSPGLSWDASHVNLDGIITVVPGALITSQPQSLTVTNGNTAHFAVVASGTAPISYQWYFNRTTPLSGETGDSLNILNAQPANTGYYSVVVTNPDGVVTSAVVRLTVRVPVAIAQGPASSTVCQGFAASFSVSATGDGPYSYQWRLNGTNLAGATGAFFSIANAQTNRSGNYDVVVVNSYSSATSAVAVLTVTPTFGGFVNKGLVGVGRLPADTFDRLGAGVDTLGGVFSAMATDPTSWTRTGDTVNGYTYSGTLYGGPDRGFGDGAQDYHPRIETFAISITPYYGNSITSQTQVVFSNTATMLLTYGGTNFTGYDPDDFSVTSFPQSSPGSLGQGHRSLDLEGLVRTADGGWFASDEYGPMILRFNASGELQYTLLPPAGLVPKNGGFPGTNIFSATNNPASGRRSNRGFEGLALLPDGKRLATVLQSPAIQDGGAANGSRNTRLLIFDIDAGSPTFGRAIAEYVYQLTLNGNSTTNRNTPISELLALNSEQFLVLERDGIGLGAPPPATPTYKRVNVLSIRGATNIINTGYDLELGAPSQTSFANATLPSNVGAVQRFDLVDIIDTNQLVKFGLNISTNQDANTIGEKWEGLALVPLNDPSAPNDYLLLVGNDNDFKAPLVYHNGVVIGTNTTVVDMMLLAYRVTLPAYCEPIPANQPPTVAITSPTNATLSAPATVSLVATPHDADGLVTNVVFYEGSTLLGASSAFPFQFTIAGRAAGTYSFTAVAIDQLGLSGTSAVKTVVVTVTNIAPTIAITSPTNTQTLGTPGVITITAAANDADGTVTNVAFFEGETLLGQKRAAPFTANVTNATVGAHSYFAIVWDNQGKTATSAVVAVTVFVRPAIASQPQSVTNNVGTSASFSVTATGDAPLAYQWRIGTNTLVGATNTSLTLFGVQLTNAGNYTVVISNSGGSVTSAVAVLTVNRPPVARDHGVATTQNQAVSITFQNLLNDATDADGDALTVTTVSGTSTNGGSVTLGATAVTYTPRAGFTGVDRFTYTIGDGRGGASSAIVEVYVASGNLPPQNTVSITATSGGYLIRFAGIPGRTYRVKRATKVSGPWTTLDTIAAPLHGIIDYQDTNPPHPAAFYMTEIQ